MRDNELVSIIRAHRADAIGMDSGDLANERSAALDHYHGRPYGNEVEGRSAVVSKDLAETVDWAMPAIMRVFTASGVVAEFEPVGPEDEEQALQESDMVNRVVMQENSGFLVLHDFFKDALILKNGYVKHWWEETEKISEEQYSGLTMEEIDLLMRQPGAQVEVIGQESHTVLMPSPQGPMPLEVFDIRLRIKRKEGRVRIEAVPTEEIRVSRRCRGDLQTSSFVEHVTVKTRSDLLEMGMPRSFVDSLPAFSGEDTGTQSLARDSVDDESSDIESANADRSMDEIEFCEAYIRVDYDEDGIAELRKVVTCADRIPPGSDWNEPISAIPITGCVPKRIPHRHVGESFDDDLADLQEVKTALQRQMLDNIYATNNNQWLVNERVNLTDFLQSLPGGVKRIRGLEPVGGSVEPVVTTPILQHILPAIDYIDRTKEGRTGVSKMSAGLDPESLRESTKGAFLENLNRASQRIEMVARMLAETGVKPMLLQVHALLIKHQNKPKIVRLRGKFVQVNPNEWRERSDMIVKVGLGTGNEEEKRQKLMLLTQMQDRANNFGLVTPAHIYEMFADLAKAMGFDMPEKYVLSPQSPEFQQKMSQPPPPDPRIQFEMQKLQAEMQMEGQKAQQTAQIEQQKAQANLQQEQIRSSNDVSIEREKIAAQMELERYKAQVKAETDLVIAKMQAQIDAQKMQMENAAELRKALMDSEIQLQGILEQAKTAKGDQQTQAIMKGLEAVIANGSKPRRVVRGADGRVEGLE